MQMKALELKEISFRYHAAPVLDRVSFDVEAGEYIGIIGPNGGGKTTLIKLVLGLLKPQSGVISVFGKPPEEYRRQGRVGYVPQRVAQQEKGFPTSVEEVVISGRTARLGLPAVLKQPDREAIERAMEVAGVSNLRERLIGEISGGERQRVFIARALASEPKILILDEPVVGVDIASQEAFYSFLTKLNREMGLTVLFVSHDVGVIANEVTRLVCLNHELVCHGHAENFIKEEFLEKLYGRKVSSVFHRH